MTTKPFVVEGFRDLQVLQRVFREAKFCDVGNDDEISASPIVADLYTRLMTALIDADVEEFGEHARDKWHKWLQTNSTRDEWHAAVQRARKCTEWLRWSKSERAAHARLLFSPFILISELEDQFIDEVTTDLER